MSPLHPYNVEMSKEELKVRVGLLEERIGELTKIVKGLQGVTSILHCSAVLAGEIMEGVLDKIEILEGTVEKI